MGGRSVKIFCFRWSDKYSIVTSELVVEADEDEMLSVLSKILGSEVLSADIVDTREYLYVTEHVRELELADGRTVLVVERVWHDDEPEIHIFI